MKLSCIIVEDEPMARNLLTQYIEKVTSLTLLAAFSSPLDALEFLRTNEPDILFLDVQMPEITGIALLKILKKKPFVILTTAYSEYAIEGYELDVTDYLLKPITFERFLKAVEKITQRLTPALDNTIIDKSTIVSNQNDFIFVKDGTKLVKVKLSEIRYIEGLKDYVRIHTPKGKITTLQRLKILEEQLPQQQFIRVHHSYIIAIEWIEVVHRDKVAIGKEMIPISDTYRKAFKDFIDNQYLGSSS